MRTERSFPKRPVSPKTAALVAVKRVYSPAEVSDGFRVLIDRLWPRGLRKAATHVDAWLKEIAPDPQLRKWFNHRPQRWSEFKRRYRMQMAEKDENLERLLEIVRVRERVTLLFAARDEERNNAVVVRDFITGLLGSEE